MPTMPGKDERILGNTQLMARALLAYFALAAYAR